MTKVEDIPEGATIHVLPNRKGGWDIKREGNKTVYEKWETKEKARKRASELTRKNKGEYILHNSDGKITERHSHKQ